MSLLGIGASLLGGLLGGGGSSSSQTSNQIDPRLAKYVYGGDGQTGILPTIYGQFQKDYAQGGLNDLQRSGMESQRQVLSSPQYSQGYDAMRSMGLGLMGGGIAQNPFTNASANRPSPSAGQAVVRPTTNLQYTPYQPQQTAALTAMNTPIQSVAQYQQNQPQLQQQTIDQMIEDYMRRMGLGRYANSVQDGSGTGLGTDYGGFDGGMAGLLGMGGDFGAGGLGSIGGADVSMGSAAGNGGDNGAELGLF